MPLLIAISASVLKAGSRNAGSQIPGRSIPETPIVPNCQDLTAIPRFPVRQTFSLGIASRSSRKLIPTEAGKIFRPGWKAMTSASPILLLG